MATPPVLLKSETIELLGRNELFAKSGWAAPPRGRVCYPKNTAAAFSYWTGAESESNEEPTLTGLTTVLTPLGLPVPSKKEERRKERQRLRGLKVGEGRGTFGGFLRDLRRVASCS